MATKKHLEKDGLTYFWGKLKEHFVDFLTTQIIPSHKVFSNEVLSIGNGETRSTSNASELDFRDQTFSADPRTSNGTRAGYITCRRTAVNDSRGNSMYVLIRSPKADGTGYSGGYDAFEFPVPDEGLSASTFYDILTTKQARVFFGVCDTAGATAAKVVSAKIYSTYALQTGDILFVRFTNSNSAAVADLTLQLNSTAAKPLKRLGNATVSNLPSAGYLVGGQTYMFWYDGTNWVANLYYNTNTTYQFQTAYDSSSNKAATMADVNAVTALTSGVVTRSSGATLTAQQIAINGKVITIHLSLTTSSATAAGSDAFSGTVASGYRPKYQSYGSGYYSTSGLMVEVTTAGALKVHVIGAQLAKSVNAHCSITYVMA